MSTGSGEKTQESDVDTVVLEIVREMSPLGVTEVEPGSELVAELGFDSLSQLELLVALEDTLKVPSVEIEAMDGVDRVADLQRVFREARARTPPTEEA